MNFNFKKFFGQNFLTNESIISRIVDGVDNFDEIFEIGAGNGGLTKELIKRNKKVTAIDIDKDCVNSLKDVDGLDLILGDILNYDIPYLPLIGNLPYNIASKILEKITFKTVPYAIFMLQKEVAELLTNIKYSKLTVFVNARYDVVKYLNVSPGNFVPRPKVDSQVVILREHEKYKNLNLLLLQKVLSMLFMQRRKKLGFIKKVNKELYDLLIKHDFDLDSRIENIPKEKIYELVFNM